MKDEVIRVQGLTKSYRLYRKPSDRLKSFFSKNIPFDLITALKDVAFSLKRGETLGIIGENGAGKSTLLKMLSGALSPTSGRLDVNGNVLSILELGVGFHPEFTGRENIFFYGDVLGFSRAFIKDKLKEIIAFSELGSFIDRPIKTYSSGMVMRLAFSIVTSFDPEILILDEVLAVGDLHFQRKSLQRILDYKEKGKTILFCSHDTYQTRMLCDKVIWLKNGGIEYFGEAEKTVLAYETYQLEKEKEQEETAMHGSTPVIIKKVTITGGQLIKGGENICVEVETMTRDENTPYNMTVAVKLKEGRGVYAASSHFDKEPHFKGSRRVLVTFLNPPLLGGFYYVHARLWDATGLLQYHNLSSNHFEIMKNETEFGICRLEHTWEVR